jgi:hypothetical protein
MVKKNPFGLLESPIHNSFSKAEAMGVVIEIFIKYLGGRALS